MNIPRVQAALGGCGAPLFTDGTDELSNLFSYGKWNGDTLERIAKLISGYKHKKPIPVTEDGYHWFWELGFGSEGGGAIRVLFPWTDGRIGEEQTKPHRSIAIYTEGEVVPEEIDHIISVLIRRFKFRLEFEIPALERTSAPK